MRGEFAILEELRDINIRIKKLEEHLIPQKRLKKDEED
jgi:hypothetical protein